MSATWWIVIAAAAVLVVALGTWLALRARRRARLRGAFGEEYDRTVHLAETRRAAEDDLLERQRRVEELDLRLLTTEERTRYRGTLRAAELRFVDDPPGAVRDVVALVAEVMEARGFETGDDDRVAEDLSVARPELVERYRRARSTATAARNGSTTTEERRKAVIDLRRVIEGLIDADAEQRTLAG